MSQENQESKIFKSDVASRMDWMEAYFEKMSEGKDKKGTLLEIFYFHRIIVYSSALLPPIESAIIQDFFFADHFWVLQDSTEERGDTIFNLLGLPSANKFSNFPMYIHQFAFEHLLWRNTVDSVDLIKPVIEYTVIAPFLTLSEPVLYSHYFAEEMYIFCDTALALTSAETISEKLQIVIKAAFDKHNEFFLKMQEDSKPLYYRHEYSNALRTYCSLAGGRQQIPIKEFPILAPVSDSEINLIVTSKKKAIKGVQGNDYVSQKIQSPTKPKKKIRNKTKSRLKRMQLATNEENNVTENKTTTTEEKSSEITKTTAEKNEILETITIKNSDNTTPTTTLADYDQTINETNEKNKIPESDKLIANNTVQITNNTENNDHITKNKTHKQSAKNKNNDRSSHTNNENTAQHTKKQSTKSEGKTTENIKNNENNENHENHENHENIVHITKNGGKPVTEAERDMFDLRSTTSCVTFSPDEILSCANFYGTKFTYLFAYLRRVWTLTPTARFVIFSHHSLVLEKLSSMLRKNGILTGISATRKEKEKSQKILEHFKAGTTRVLLMNFQSASAGTVEASHIIFLDPQGKKSVAKGYVKFEAHALGMVYAQNQATPLVVVRFIIANTCEHAAFLQKHTDHPLKCGSLNPKKPSLRNTPLGTYLANDRFAQENEAVKSILERFS
eukprot:Phypoly_transcript_04112.p1 GENE.Phypoly_transcript_04112~~Phypoly_transcript_04112.p1  ORF type:complete len:748 (+),score=113.68 Phypoly_transcript_04112:222-2246(+)